MQRRIHREIFNTVGAIWPDADQLLVFYDTFDNDSLARIRNEGNTAIIVLNARLLYDKSYIAKIEAIVKKCLSPDVINQFRNAIMTLADAIVLYVATAVSYGHLNPAEYPSVSISDWKSYAGEIMWNVAYCFVDKRAINAKGSNCPCVTGLSN